MTFCRLPAFAQGVGLSVVLKTMSEEATLNHTKTHYCSATIRGASGGNDAVSGLGASVLLSTHSLLNAEP
jgi:hypothetical protein